MSSPSTDRPQCSIARRLRAAARGLDHRISTHLAELPDGARRPRARRRDLGVDVAAPRRRRDQRRSSPRRSARTSGLLAVAEVAEPMRVLPDDLDVGRPGLADRLERAESRWFAAMRAGLPDSVPSIDLAAMLTAAGLAVVGGSRLARERFDPPLSEAARNVVVERTVAPETSSTNCSTAMTCSRSTCSGDADDPRGVMHRARPLRRRIAPDRRRSTRVTPGPAPPACDVSGAGQGVTIANPCVGASRTPRRRGIVPRSPCGVDAVEAGAAQQAEELRLGEGDGEVGDAVVGSTRWTSTPLLSVVRYVRPRSVKSQSIARCSSHAFGPLTRIAIESKSCSMVRASPSERWPRRAPPRRHRAAALRRPGGRSCARWRSRRRSRASRRSSRAAHVRRCSLVGEDGVVEQLRGEAEVAASTYPCALAITASAPPNAST